MIGRVNYRKAAPDALQAMSGLSAYLDECGLDPKLRYLIEVRVSQINGCIYCVDSHTQQARTAGEAQQRLDCLPVWREAPFFSARERAALAWAESVTLVAQTGVPDAVYEEACAHFNEKELVDLTYVIMAMNAWNRLGVSMRLQPSAR
jgi:AhpD family alkylhydroperoxidase